MPESDIIAQIKSLVYKARKQRIYLGDILVELLREEGADSEFEHLLSRQLMGPDNPTGVKGYIFGLQYPDRRDHFITYRGDAQAIAGLLSLIATEITRREDVGIFIARLVSTALQETDDIVSN